MTVTEKALHDAHMLGRWIGADQFKIKLPIGSRGSVHVPVATSKASTEGEARAIAKEHFLQNCREPVDPESISISVWLGHNSTYYRCWISFTYLELQPRECTFQTVAAIEVPHEESNPLVRTFRILGCSRGQNTWGESKWFYAATISDQHNLDSAPIFAIKHTSMEDALKLLYRRAKHKTLKALRV